jgi:hypothetical protein
LLTPGGHTGTLIISQRLTYNIVKGLPVPATGNKITFDTEVTGLGARVTAAVERRYTIGAFPDWSVAAVRCEAAEYSRQLQDRQNIAAPQREKRAAVGG